MDYQYPLQFDWSTEEIVEVINFFQAVEKAYEKGITRDDFMEAYQIFKGIVPSKAEEKKLCDEFEESSGYSSYKVVKTAKNSEPGTVINMK